MKGKPSQPKTLRTQRTERWLALTREPSTFDDICLAQAEGRGIIPWCRERDVRYLDVMAWIDSDASRAFAFQVATQARGTTTVAQLESVTRQAMAGSVDPRAAAVASKNLTWLASVYNRKLYGEQMRVDHRHGLAEDHLAVLKAIVGVGGSQHAANSVPARIAREDRPAIEGQFRSTPDAERQPVQRSAQPIDRSDLLDV